MSDSTTEASQKDAWPEAGGETSPARKIALLAILVALIAIVLFATWYYLAHRRLPIPRIGITAEEQVAPPEYVFSIAGPAGPDALTRPVGVAVLGGSVYITDTEARVIRVYSLNGNYRFSFAAIEDGDNTRLGNPQHISAGPDGNIYVSDRRLRSIYVFTAEGQYLREIALNGEEEQLWGPLGTTFDGQGNLYATDVGITDMHRVLVFDPQGAEIRRFGRTGTAERMTDLPGSFFFPNHIAIADDGTLFVSDSNNRRVQVFDSQGNFERIIQTAGIPRGLAIDEEDRLYVVDALAHAVDIYTLQGEKIASFGGRGIGPGQFAFPNAIDLDEAGRIYVTDRENHQVQVWEWAQADIVLPPPPAVDWSRFWWLLPPLLLLPLLLLLRRRKSVVTADFVEALAAAGKIDAMRRGRVRWIVPSQLHGAFTGKVIDGVDVGRMIKKAAYSDSDAAHLAGKRGISYDDAALLVLAKRAKRLCTEDARLKAWARRLGVEVFNAEEYSRRVLKDVDRARERE